MRDECDICKVDKGQHLTGCPNGEAKRVSDKLNSLVRYENVGEHCCDMQPFEDGDWVKFDDVKQILSND